ncbi:MAG: hypothetical protein IJ583_06750 [Firmicutes bacterium]|nr:hypothetical protein [Bacillota bacterium]
MNNYRSIKSFLIEFNIMFVVFVICVVIVLGLFAAAKEKSEMSRNKTEAYNIAQRLAEQFKTYDRVDDSAKWETNKDGNACCYYNDDWNLCSINTAKYEVEMKITPEENEIGYFYRSVITVFEIENGGELCNIEVYDYKQKDIKPE